MKADSLRDEMLFIHKIDHMGTDLGEVERSDKVTVRRIVRLEDGLAEIPDGVFIQLHSADGISSDIPYVRNIFLDQIHFTGNMPISAALALM